ncbi:HPr family phosphocarrier protein [candidate division NPL-UPA2 bacterium]|nr:HPr family phosphocarrier protein [candidate division NPL-UPA2 bacterium]
MNDKFEAWVKVENELGLHARAAALFVQRASEFQCRILVEKDSQKVDGKSIMGVMILEAGKGSRIRITAEGNQAQAAIIALEELVKSKFGEK